MAIFRKGGIVFAEALHRAWQSAKARPQNAAAIAAAKASAGIAEDCKTWADWKAAGYEVIHGSKALFRARPNLGKSRRWQDVHGKFFRRKPSAAD